jgi:hypothetical protein
MKCPFVKEVPYENSEQKYQKIQKLEQKLDNLDNESRTFFFQENSWRDCEY